MTSVLVAFLRHPLALLSAVVLLLLAPVSTAYASSESDAQLAFDVDSQAGLSFGVADRALSGAEWRSADLEQETIAVQELPEQAAVLAWVGWSAATPPLRLPDANPGAELPWLASLRWCDRSARGPPTI